MTNQGVAGYPGPGLTVSSIDQFLPFPQAPSGRWYGPTIFTTGAAGSSAGTLNRLEYAPILLSTGTLDRIGVNHLATPTGSELARLGLYASSVADPSKPGSLVLDAGTVDLSTSTAVKSINISLSVTRGLYWLAVAKQGPSATATLVTLPVPAASMQSLVAAPVDATTLYNKNRTLYIETGITGAFPAVASPAATGAVTTIFASAVRYL